MNPIFDLIAKPLVHLAGRTNLLAKKNAPVILLVLGVAGIGGTIYLSCKATLKCDALLDEANENLDKVKKAREAFNEEVYTPADYKKDMINVYMHTGFAFAKLYAPSAVLGIVSMGLIIGSHNILSKRNLALMAAYKSIQEGFNAYRKRVVEEFGEDKDVLFKNGLRAEKIYEETTDEAGKPCTKINQHNVKDPDGNISIYARYFDHDTTTQWSPNSTYNLSFLKQNQNYFNDLLSSRGHVFLNEVYTALGFDHTSEGAVVGWVSNNPRGGDNGITFGIYEVDIPGYRDDQTNDTISQERRDFVNGYTTSILLDFNVDGVIYDLI